MATDGPRDRSYKDTTHAIDREFVSAPPSNDPACFLHVDAIPVRDALESEVDAIRAAAGARSASAAAFRQRRARDHLKVAAEFVLRRREGRSASDDALCRDVQAALDKGVVGSCAYCGCNFSVVAVVDVKGGSGSRVCGVCFQTLRAHQPAPMVRPHAANVEERFKGWTPW